MTKINRLIFIYMIIGCFIKTQVFASSSDKERESILTLDEIERTVTKLDSKKKKKFRRKFESVSVHELEDLLVAKISQRLYRVVTEFDDKPNAVFQTAFSQIRQKSEMMFLRKLPDFGQAERGSDLNKKHFASIWLSAINSVFEEEVDEADVHRSLEQDIISFSDDEDGPEHSSVTPRKIKFKTTLLNILLRRSSCLELVEKFQTMIENGADKNLHAEFSSSPKMENQKEYPLYIILNQITQNSMRKSLLSILLNDNITYSFGNLTESDCRIDKAVVSLKPNKEFVLMSLLERDDFPTFYLVLTYLESSVIFVTETYHDRISQIDDQIFCPILEKVLKRMMLVRRKSTSSDAMGDLIDNISEFFSSKKLNKQMRVNSDARFSLNFQNRLEKDFEKLFQKIAIRINKTRTESELRGEDLKGYIIEWTKWANFRNRIASHLNKFALSASNQGKKSNVIKLIRYANIYNKKDIDSEEDELFRELHELGGADIIFTKRNKLKWTPLMYAMFQKQSEGIQLYLRQAPHEITSTDGVDNNILHLAFPLPAKYFKQESSSDTENVLDLVGANVGAVGAKEKTFEAIRAIITERSISVEEKTIALLQLSASNFTPVSLAAATGYVEIYEFMQGFLKASSAWNEDDHAHLGVHVKELLVSGLKSYKASKANHDNLTSSEGNFLEQEIKKRAAVINNSNKLCIREIYHPESPKAVKLLVEIKKPVRKILDDFYKQSGARRKESPYPVALNAAMEQMINPAPIIEKILLPPPTPLQKPKVASVKKKKKKFRFKDLFKKKKKTKLKLPENEEKPKAQLPRYKETSKPSILVGMRSSTSSVKASYLAQIVKEVTELFLRDHASPHQMSFSAVYKGLTNIDTKEFFQRKFNSTIEQKMEAVILSTLKNSGRLRLDMVDEEETQNRFDKLGEISSDSDDSQEEPNSSDEDDGFSSDGFSD